MVEAQTGRMDAIDYDAWRKNIRSDVTANFHYCMALAIAREANRDAAIKHFRLALEANPDWGAPYFELAELLMAAGRSAEAEEVRRIAVAHCPTYEAEGLLHRGRELAQINHFDALPTLIAAAENFESVREQAHNEIAHLLVARAKLQKAAGDHAAYIDILLQAEGYGCQDPQGLYDLSLHYHQQGDGAKAVKTVLKACHHAQRDEKVKLLIAASGVLRMEMRLPEAIAALSEACELAPSMARPRALLGSAMLALGHADGLDHLRAAIDLDGASAGIRMMYGEGLYAAGFQKEAKEVLVRLRDNDPTNHRVESDISLILAEDNQIENAVLMARTAAEHFSQSNWVWTNLGLVLDLAGQHVEAQKAFRQATVPSAQSEPRMLWFQARLRPRYQKRLFHIFRELQVPMPIAVVGD